MYSSILCMFIPKNFMVCYTNRYSDLKFRLFGICKNLYKYGHETLKNYKIF